MINITLIRGDNQYQAARYFTTADDYYAKDDVGEWQGISAEALGLVGSIDQKQLAKLLDGQLPNGERIQATFDKETGKKRMGMDVTFSAPKSVSLQALVGGDRAVTDAHDRAVAKALLQLEKLAIARKKVRGVSTRELTGNLVIGKFRHELSRAKDPQLHTHAVILNMTQRSDGAWRALSNEDIYLVQHEIDALYKIELANNLRELGYGTRVLDAKGNFELAHITRDQIEAFSERARTIEEALANEGKTRATATVLEKQIISMALRPKKEKLSQELIKLLKEYWVDKSLALGIDYGPRSTLDDGYLPSSPHVPKDSRPSGAPEHSSPQAPPEDRPPSGLTWAQVAVRYAIKHRSEREAVVDESDLKTVALRRAVGLASEREVQAELDRLVKSGDLIPGVDRYKSALDLDSPSLTLAGWKRLAQEREGGSSPLAKRDISRALSAWKLVPVARRFTTRQAFKCEKAIMAIERDGRGQIPALILPEAVRDALKSTTLTPGQCASVEVMLSTHNRFVGIEGDAGTGKSYAVKEAIALLNKAGTAAPNEAYKTIALAPYGNQVKALKEDGLDARTLASFLAMRIKPIDDRTIVLLDEAGVVPSRQMMRIMRVVEKAGARMVMLGDTKQTEAIEAGKPFAQLLAAGMKMARISEILRQENSELKKAVEFAAEGDVNASLRHVGPITSIKDPTKRHEAVVDSYMGLDAKQRDQAIIMAGTNDARKEINDLVRIAMDLKGKGRDFDTLIREDLTQAQRGYAPSYERGMLIQPDRDYPRLCLKRGELYEVRDALPGNRLLLRTADGTELTLNPQRLSNLSVYKPEVAELAVGDLMRINRNFAKEDLTNGDRYRVASVIGKLVTLESVALKEGEATRTIQMMGNSPLHLQHAYAATVHSAQGLTRNTTFTSLSARSRTTSMNLYYVAISRARHMSRIFTDSMARLPTAIARRYEKTTAMSIQLERLAQRGVRKPGTGVSGGYGTKKTARPGELGRFE